MCGDSHLPPAPESGDLIAIIHPNSQSTFRGRLKLSNRMPGATSSSLQCDGDTVCGPNRNGLLNVRIHKYGQPLSMSENSNIDSESEDEDNVENPILYSFFLNTMNSSTTGNLRLNLGVGGDGIVGRTVSIVESRGGRVLGEGVIGWG
ncbi:uncharacterized protein Z518_09346 [Rhinocladiella mackenziei CBS 650.93]|uniref:Rhinocladiella mackenziei CBS 650.93 unplaced genomic scaffold supercont1.7, whole genome shotgun sequence n=1 Tax=Rhinocladiella mackenziei CBS 650.93 TaxID=1442369 RepID=A0A0D2IYF2_9EURO|nr:uncharacterized protein Z518_09346 [Rhinocladiella mackenziei CBS 650.93]KIX01620.1 hypothetical protein Z518_09346 [Rhinocladiella mackenziei CBS 650.93]